ncbi:hypothetical protein WHR41_03549 [Cladosporium halotolerans]|uniref:Ricin B lectin domain-containing protein n=1 Tax=Cladosporium halotolerans TaxID=1052096 RepID=A0AB34KRW1_9PEZI
MSSSNKPFYITSVSNGHVLSNQANGSPSGVVAENRGDQGDEEKWTLEAGDEPNVVALKNASNGKYLHANGGTSWCTVGTGEKQWWRLSNDELSPPGACRLSPVPYPGVFLNHFQGQAARKGAVGIKVHMWQWEGHVPQWLSWYFMDANNVGFNPLAPGALSSASSDSGASKADLDSKLKALEEREAALAKKDKEQSAEWEKKMKNAQDGQAALAKKDKDQSAEWDKKMKDLQNRQASAVSEEKQRTDDYNKKLKELQAREDELAKKEQQAKSSKGATGDKSDKDDQTKKDADIQRKLDNLKSAEQKIAADRAALSKAKTDLAAKEKDLEQRRKKLEDRKPTNGQNGSAESDLQKKQRDNAQLEKRLARLEDQLANMNGSSDAEADKPQVNGTSNGSASKGAGSAGCGFKHYKPPRKINRKVVGLLYE